MFGQIILDEIFVAIPCIENAEVLSINIYSFLMNLIFFQNILQRIFLVFFGIVSVEVNTIVFAVTIIKEILTLIGLH